MYPPTTYKRAVQIAVDLIGESVTRPGQAEINDRDREYARGIVEFMADFFPQEAAYMDERKAKVARDLGIEPEEVK